MDEIPIAFDLTSAWHAQSLADCKRHLRFMREYVESLLFYFDEVEVERSAIDVRVAELIGAHNAFRRAYHDMRRAEE
jgi:hypothetical protein